MKRGPPLSLAEWTGLAPISEHPARGFTITQSTAPGGDVGRIWHIPRPVIYRAISRLEQAGLVAPQAVQSGRGPSGPSTPPPGARQLRTDWTPRPACPRRPVAPADQVHASRPGRNRSRRPAPAAEGNPPDDPRPPAPNAHSTGTAWRRATATAALSFLGEPLTAVPTRT
jgi:hypothetical protein